MNKTDKILVIVESPIKSKTIAEILKKAGYTKAVVIGTAGHIIELKDGGPAWNSGIYPKQKFKMKLEVMESKYKIVEDIKNRAKNVDKVLLMQDGDREGEIQSWSLIKFCDLPYEKCYRVITHEITPKAVIYAIENPVPFDDNLVNAGLTRIMVDKLLGFSLSPLARKYIGAKSIGRCQSVGLKLVSDREKEIRDFIPEMYFNLYLNFVKKDKKYKAKYIGYKEEIIENFTKQVDVNAVINYCKNGTYVIKDIKTIKHQESPKVPFCTATFQQEASSKLGLRVKDAMSCAQKLFEGIKVNGEHIGLITYLRSDSTELAPEFIPTLKEFIEVTYGTDKYTGPRKAKQKSTDQNGHEALRVTDPTMTPEKLAGFINNDLLIKVYRLIWQRTVASAMPNAIISKTIYTIENSGHKFKLSQKELLNAGYKAVYKFEDNQDFGSNQAFELNEVLENVELESEKYFTQPHQRYTEAGLVKELQRLEIGRPATYSSIVETLLSPSRGYATLEEKHIVPTDRGIQLAEYCNRSFPTLINISYTKEMEERLDKIASGSLNWLDYMESFYENLKSIVNTTSEIGLATDLPTKECPECGKTLIVRRSRFGKLFYGCDYPRCKHTENII